MIINTDASKDAVAGCVQQRDEQGILRPLGFDSKKLNLAERNYTVHDKELLAMVKPFEAFRHWLPGTREPVEVWSDHAAPETLPHAEARTGGGKTRGNSAADALSRKETHDGRKGAGSGWVRLGLPLSTM